MSRIIIFGNGEAPITALNFLKSQGHDLLIIVDDRDKGVNVWQKSLLKYCIDKKIKFMKPNTIKNRKFYKSIKDFNPDLIFSIQYRKIIGKEIINIVDGEIFNFHFSNLPKNRGCYPGFWHIKNGDKYAGVTLHKLITGIDSGPIIDQKKKRILVSDTTKSIYFWCIKEVLYLLKLDVNNLLSKNYSIIKQDESRSSYYSRLSVDFDDNNVNWKLSSFTVARYIQAYTFPPYQYPKTRLRKEKIEIIKLHKWKKEKIKFDPGIVISKRNNIYNIQTSDGSCTISLLRKPKMAIRVGTDMFY